jgi:hypothetical protein
MDILVVVLWCNGIKLAALVIWKGVPNGTINWKCQGPLTPKKIWLFPSDGWLDNYSKIYFLSTSWMKTPRQHMLDGCQQALLSNL